MKRASILVTDDESNIRMLLRTSLESEGYNVREASNGREALTAIVETPPDLVVLDLNMPVLDGIAVLEQMKTLTPKAQARVIILTAYGSIPAAVKATRLGAVDFLEKPITPTDLRQSVRSVLEEPELDGIGGGEIPEGYELVLGRIRKALRLADFTSAATLLARAAESCEKHTAEYFNLLGVLYEAQHKWRLARKCYEKAMDANPKYEPAQVNSRRVYELHLLGHTSRAVVLEDKDLELMAFRLPEIHP